MGKPVKADDYTQHHLRIAMRTLPCRVYTGIRDHRPNTPEAPVGLIFVPLGAILGAVFGIAACLHVYRRVVPARCSHCGGSAYYDSKAWPHLIFQCRDCGGRTDTPITFRGRT